MPKYVPWLEDIMHDPKELIWECGGRVTSVVNLLFQGSVVAIWSVMWTCYSNEYGSMVAKCSVFWTCFCSEYECGGKVINVVNLLFKGSVGQNAQCFELVNPMNMGVWLQSGQWCGKVISCVNLLFQEGRGVVANWSVINSPYCTMHFPYFGKQFHRACGIRKFELFLDLLYYSSFILHCILQNVERGIK
jgi:hypothetical protein